MSETQRAPLNMDEAIDSIGRAINAATYKIISDEQATKATLHLADLREEIEQLRSLLSAREAALEKANAALAYVTVLDETFTGVVFYSIVGRPFLPGEKHYEAIDAAFKARRLAHATSAETARGEGER